MSSLIDDIRDNFIGKNGAIGRLIAINVAVFVATATVGVFLWLMGVDSAFGGFIQSYLGLSSRLSTVLFRPWTLFTYMFVHSLTSVFHILFNMLWLYWIGGLYRQYKGDRDVWSTYILGGLSGGLFYLISYQLFPRLQGAEAYLIGASAGVNAVIVGTATLLPNYAIHLLFFGPVKLKWIAIFFIILDLVSIPGGNAGGMLAHLGGALYGFLFIHYYYKDVDISAPFVKTVEKIAGWFRRPAPKPKYAPQMRVTHRNVPPVERAEPRTPVGEIRRPTQHEIDRILDKIKAVGYDKLTKEEKQTLFNAGQND